MRRYIGRAFAALLCAGCLALACAFAPAAYAAVPSVGEGAEISSYGANAGKGQTTVYLYTVSLKVEGTDDFSARLSAIATDTDSQGGPLYELRAVPTDGVLPYSFQWYRSVDGGPYELIPGATSDVYDLPGAAARSLAGEAAVWELLEPGRSYEYCCMVTDYYKQGGAVLVKVTVLTDPVGPGPGPGPGPGGDPDDPDDPDNPDDPGGPDDPDDPDGPGAGDDPDNPDGPDGPGEGGSGNEGPGGSGGIGTTGDPALLSAMPLALAAVASAAVTLFLFFHRPRRDEEGA